MTIDAIRSRLRSERGRTALRRILFFLAGAFALLFSSECSPLYPISTSVDTNAFRSSATYMLGGKVLYNDFFEVKGPYIYFMYILSILISPDTFHGVYILEAATAFFCFEFTYKAVRVMFPGLPEKYAFLGTMMGGVCTYVSTVMWQGGQAETFALPLYSYLLYLLTIVVRDGKAPQAKQCLFAGMHAGLIFWTKYLALAPYVGCFFALAVFCIRKRDGRMLAFVCLRCAAGFLAVTCATIAYFIATGSFGSMIDVYFIHNIFYYDVAHYGMTIAVIRYFIANPMQFTLPFIAMVVVALDPNANSEPNLPCRYAVASLAVSAAILFATECIWLYYYVPLMSYNGIIVCALLDMGARRGRRIFSAAVTMASLVFALSFALPMSSYKKALASFDTRYEARTAAAEIIGSGSFILLNHMDDGLYFLTGYLPDCYYFDSMNTRTDDVKASYLGHISDGDIDSFVLYSDRGIDDFDSYVDSLSEQERDYLSGYIDQILASERDFSDYEAALAENGYKVAGVVPAENNFDFIIYKKEEALA